MISRIRAGRVVCNGVSALSPVLRPTSESKFLTNGRLIGVTSPSQIQVGTAGVQRLLPFGSAYCATTSLAIQQLTSQVIARMVFIRHRPPASDDCLNPESRGITRADHVIEQVIPQSLAD